MFTRNFRLEFGWFYLKRHGNFISHLQFAFIVLLIALPKSYFQWIFRPTFQKQLQTGREAGAKIFPLRRDENLFLDNKHKTSLLLFAARWKARAENKWDSLLGIPGHKPQICIQEQSSAENLLSSKCNRI